MIQGVRYNITNEAIIGACFLPMGIGNISKPLHLSLSRISPTVASRCSFVGHAVGLDAYQVAKAPRWRVGPRGPAACGDFWRSDARPPLGHFVRSHYALYPR